MLPDFVFADRFRFSLSCTEIAVVYTCGLAKLQGFVLRHATLDSQATPCLLPSTHGCRVILLSMVEHDSDIIYTIKGNRTAF